MRRGRISPDLEEQPESPRIQGAPQLQPIHAPGEASKSPPKKRKKGRTRTGGIGDQPIVKFPITLPVSMVPNGAAYHTGKRLRADESDA